MRRTNLLVYLAILIVIAFTSCKKQGMEVEVFSLKKEYSLCEENPEAAQLTFSAEVEFPTKYHNQEILKSVQQQIIGKVLGEVFNSFPIDSVLTKYSNTIFDEYRKSNEPFLKQIRDLEGSKAFLNNEIYIQGIAMYLDDDILSYSYERYAYMGGAHGNSSRFLYNFDIKTGKTFGESDLFNEGYDVQLAQLIKEQIVEDNAEIQSVADLNDFDFYENQIVSNNNFYITPEGLIYIYNPYDIAPYSTGQIAVMLPFSKLIPILRKGNPVEYLYYN